MSDIKKLEEELAAAKLKAKQNKSAEASKTRRAFLADRIVRDNTELAELEVKAGLREPVASDDSE